MDILSLTVPEPNSGCWLWAGTITDRGYGRYFCGSLRKRAHRLSWEVHNGPVPDGLHVLHRCDVRCCVNPEHLFLGTSQDNTADMMRKGRWRGRRRLTREAVFSILEDPRPYKQIAADHGVHPSHVSQIKRGADGRFFVAAAISSGVKIQYPPRARFRLAGPLA